ncbi:MAG TPA: hypothetical protein VGN34_09030 [Ktedonobacteraceae bacterium]
MASICPSSEISVARTRASLLRVSQAVKMGFFTLRKIPTHQIATEDEVHFYSS